MRLRARPEGVAAAYADAGRPPGRTAWREARWCALDLELTGLDPDKDEIVAIGAVPIEHGRLILANSMYTLVRSSRRSEHDAVLMHKLRVADLADAPPLERAAEMVIEVLAGRVPVFHTGWVETSFLAPLFSAAHLRLPAAADTELVGRLFLHFRDGIAPARLSLAGLSELLGQSGEAAAPRAGRCADDRAGVHRARLQARGVRASDGRVADRRRQAARRRPALRTRLVRPQTARTAAGSGRAPTG